MCLLISHTFIDLLYTLNIGYAMVDKPLLRFFLSPFDTDEHVYYDLYNVIKFPEDTDQ